MAIITPPPTSEDLGVRPNTELIFVFDDLLPAWIQQWGAEQMDAFDWRYGQASYPGGARFFGQILKDHAGVQKQPWPLIIDLIIEAFLRTKLKEIIPDARFLESKKIIANGQLPSTPANPHSDTQSSNMWTMIYHCSDTLGGNNLFFDSDTESLTIIKEVEFKQGRCVLFPSWYIHQGLAPVEGWRITIAYHMQIETRINPPRFISSVL
jgi:hypothetical protein